MKKYFLLFLIILFYKPNYSYQFEIGLKIMNSSGVFISNKKVELYIFNNVSFHLYRWGYTNSNTSGYNGWCDVIDCEDYDLTENPIWDYIGPGTYYLKIDNKYCYFEFLQNEGCISRGSPDIIISYNGTFYLDVSSWACSEISPTYTGNFVNIEFQQFKSDGVNTVGNVSILKNSYFSTKPSPGNFLVAPNNTYLLEADQNLLNAEKYNKYREVSDVKNFREQYIGVENYSTTADFRPVVSNIILKNNFLEFISLNPNNDIILFKDPWLIDFNDPQHFNRKRNRGSEADFLNRNSPFNPDFYTNYEGNTYKGVFLNENPQFQQGLPIYSVRAPLTQNIYLSQTGKTHKFYFQNWSTSGASLEQMESSPSGYDQKAVVFTSSNATVNANYKGTQLSSDANAFSNNSQRRFIETKINGVTWLHQVYSSLERIWLEHSSDGGITWFIGNSGQPVNGSSIAKNPSIAFTYQDFGYGDENYYIGIIWQEKYNSTYRIKARMCTQLSSGNNIPAYFSSTTTLYTETRETYIGYNANPNLVLSNGWAGAYLFTIEKKTATGSYPAGINWFVGFVQGGSGQLNDYFNPPTAHGLIGGTNGTTTNVQLSEADYETISANFVYQQGTYSGGIYTGVLYFAYNGYWDLIEYNDGLVSYPSANINPSIVTLPDYFYGANWIEYETLVYYRYNGSINYFETGVRSSSINRGGNTNSGFIAWSKQNYSGAWFNKFMRFDNGTPVSGSISTLNTSGKYVQTGNGAGTDLSQMYVSSFYQLNTPFFFRTSTALGPLPLSKDKAELITGRGFILNNGDATYTYRLEDLNVDGKNISFVDAPDEKNYGKIEELNNVLLTEPFTINQNTKIVFSEKSGFSDSSIAIKFLGKNGFINYKLELIDNATGKVLSTIKDNKLSSANAPGLRTPGYLLNANGFAGKTVRIKITLETNLIKENKTQLVSGDTTAIPDHIKARLNVKRSNLILTKNFKEENETITKSTLSSLEVIDLELPTTYALEQNYPNPFNPSTRIKYQIPQDGLVTLKIYDILGEEVKTLVNETKSIGRYEVEFHASDLASGTYIYQIRVNDFTSAKKMLLIK